MKTMNAGKVKFVNIGEPSSSSSLVFFKKKNIKNNWTGFKFSYEVLVHFFQLLIELLLMSN